jgi:hypothetical protein
MKKHKILDWVGLTLCIFVLVFALFYASGINLEVLVLWLAIGLVSLFGVVRGVKGLLGKSNQDPFRKFNGC